MTRLERLLANYERRVALPWEASLSGPQKVWFIVYDPAEERRIHYRHREFGIATERAGHKWVEHDLADAFAEWMARQEYRESYFRNPDDLHMALSEFRDYLAERLRSVLSPADATTVVAVYGLGGLFGFVRVSTLIPLVESAIAGRLVVFFPGEFANNNYRFLGARDGWNYLAVPITSNNGVYDS